MTRAAKAAEHFARAEELSAEGKPGVAKIYYQMALRAGSDELRTLASQRLATIGAVQRN